MPYLMCTLTETTSNQRNRAVDTHITKEMILQPAPPQKKRGLDMELWTEPADTNKWELWINHGLRTGVPGGTVHWLKLTCPGLESRLGPELGAKRVEPRTKRNLPTALVNGEKDRELKVVAGATPVFLIVPKVVRNLLQILLLSPIH